MAHTPNKYLIALDGHRVTPKRSPRRLLQLPPARRPRNTKIGPSGVDSTPPRPRHTSGGPAGSLSGGPCRHLARHKASNAPPRSVAVLHSGEGIDGRLPGRRTNQPLQRTPAVSSFGGAVSTDDRPSRVPGPEGRGQVGDRGTPCGRIRAPPRATRGCRPSAAHLVADRFNCRHANPTPQAIMGNRPRIVNGPEFVARGEPPDGSVFYDGGSGPPSVTTVRPPPPWLSESGVEPALEPATQVRCRRARH